ncbi:MAG: TRAP transporter small permease [Deltaproteobacteria bacterium]|nr:TRAP transporter small permease [Deltaproteobacteria bacterium]
MGGLLWLTEKMSRTFNWIALCALTFIMLLTVSDVVLRYFGHPIVGTFEIVGFCGALIIGFALPLTSWHRGHIFVDFLTVKMSKKIKKTMDISTRILCITLFIIVGWNLFIYSQKLYRSGEVSLTIQIPFYPFSYGLGVACFLQCLVLIADVVKIFRGTYDE